MNDNSDSDQQGTSSSAKKQRAIVGPANQCRDVVRVNIDARHSRNGKFMLTKMLQHLVNAIRGRNRPVLQQQQESPQVKSIFDQMLEQFKNDEEGISTFADRLITRIDELGNKAVELTEYDEKLLCFITFAKPFFECYAVKMDKDFKFRFGLSLLVPVLFPEDFLERLVDIIEHTPEPKKLVTVRLQFGQPMKWPKKLGNPAMLAADGPVQFLDRDSTPTLYKYALMNLATVGEICFYLKFTIFPLYPNTNSYSSSQLAKQTRMCHGTSLLSAPKHSMWNVLEGHWKWEFVKGDGKKKLFDKNI